MTKKILKEETVQALGIEKTFESLIGETNVETKLDPNCFVKKIARDKIRTTPQIKEFEEPAQIEKLNQLCGILGVSKFNEDE